MNAETKSAIVTGRELNINVGDATLKVNACRQMDVALAPVIPLSIVVRALAGRKGGAKIPEMLEALDSLGNIRSVNMPSDVGERKKMMFRLLENLRAVRYQDGRWELGVWGKNESNRNIKDAHYLNRTAIEEMLAQFDAWWRQNEQKRELLMQPERDKKQQCKLLPLKANLDHSLIRGQAKFEKLLDAKNAEK